MSTEKVEVHSQASSEHHSEQVESIRDGHDNLDIRNFFI